MINGQLLTKEVFLKLDKEQAWEHYERLVCRFKNSKNTKVTLRDELENEQQIVRNIKINVELQRLRDRKYGSSAHERTHALKEEAISIWWEIKRVNTTQQVGYKKLGNMHEKQTQLLRVQRVRRIIDEAPREDDHWLLSKSTYQRINKAAKKAWRHSEIINDSGTFLEKTLEYYRS
jgi:hypothetical protein